MNTDFLKTFVKVLLNISFNVRKQKNLFTILKCKGLKSHLALPRIKKKDSQLSSNFVSLSSFAIYDIFSSICYVTPHKQEKVHFYDFRQKYFLIFSDRFHSHNLFCVVRQTCQMCESGLLLLTMRSIPLSIDKVTKAKFHCQSSQDQA